MSNRVNMALVDLASEAARYRAAHPKTRPSGHVTDAEIAAVRRCVHEAGHAVIAEVLGVPIATANQTRCEYAAAIPEPVSAPITFAGSYAESYWHVGGRPDPTTIRMALDTNTADRESLYSEGAHARNVAEEVVVPLVKRSWPQVMGLAALLFRHGALSHADVWAALGGQDGIRRLRRAVPGRYQIYLPPVKGDDDQCHCHDKETKT